MKPTDVFTLDVPGGDDVTRSGLALHGRRVGTVYGTHIDAQFAVEAVGYLLFVSFDNIFSAIESMYVVDPGGAIIDELRLGHALEEGLLTHVEPDGAGAVRFRFPGSQLRVVRVGKRSTWLGLKSRWLTLADINEP